MDIVDDNPSDDNMWVENDIGMDGERVRTFFSFLFDGLFPTR